MQPPPCPPETRQAQHEPTQQEPDWLQLPFEEQVPPPQQNPARRIFRIAVVLAGFVTLLFLLRYYVFTISQVQVVGNRAVSWEEVARSAGLDRKLLYFTVNEDEIADGINAHRYLAFEAMEKVFPNTLILYVRERVPSAFFTHLGVGFVMADDGMILEKSRDLALRQGLIEVSGLEIWGQLEAGMFPVAGKAGQLDALIALIGEVVTQGYANQVRDMNVSDENSLTMTTLDGYTVHLGSMESLRAKIGTVRAVIGELKRRDLVGGVLEASIPGEATYRAREGGL
ncbi:MAG: FtsQ-type POTRA domain-containing protein [Eubacteriales bacterium]|nr:FtsQ-type POTRA domain-containing protein [Eubacteriales bacterium]